MYTDLINQTISQVYQKGVATKILQGMDHIRNEFDELQACRWPTELLQNARDLSVSGRPVRVRIELTDNAVRFLHSGRPFSVKDILSIINQVSSKKPGEGVGQFGTGFLSTFQLSMQVEVRSYLKEDGEPYRPFRVCLDRSGTTQEAISAAIQQAVDALRAVDQAQAVDTLEPDGLHTEFRYHLRDQRSQEVARMGMEDLRRTLPCILLFSQRLGEVQLVAETEGRRETVTFRRGPAEELSDGLLRQKILAGRRTQTWFVLRREGISLAAVWDKYQGFLPLPASSPRLYIDFPLIGSEQFPFPVVLNSLAMRPNEPRSNISLVEHEESLDARENRALVDRAVTLYQEFFSRLLAVDRRGVEHLLAIPPQEERREWCTMLGGYSLPEKLCITVRSALEGASDALVRGLCPGAEPTPWLAALYDLGMEAEGTAIRAGEFSLFPSQDSEDLASGRLYSAREICQDPGIPEFLKDCAEKLDGLGESPGGPQSRNGYRPMAGDVLCQSRSVSPGA